MNAHGYAVPGKQEEQETLCSLLLQTAQGDGQSFTTLYHLTSQRVYGFARRIVRNPELARDITQEVFLMVWRDAHKYDQSLGSAVTWLMTITHHRAVDRVRSEQASTNRELRWSTANVDAEYDTVAETVADRMETQRVVRCVRNLSTLQREAITLAYYDGLSYREVAERLSAPLPTVKSRIRDALRHLRTRLDKT